MLARVNWWSSSAMRKPFEWSDSMPSKEKGLTNEKGTRNKNKPEDKSYKFDQRYKNYFGNCNYSPDSTNWLQCYHRVATKIQSENAKSERDKNFKNLQSGGVWGGGRPGWIGYRSQQLAVSRRRGHDFGVTVLDPSGHPRRQGGRPGQGVERRDSRRRDLGAEGIMEREHGLVVDLGEETREEEEGEGEGEVARRLHGTVVTFVSDWR
jgi:hypothetical protein